MALRDQPYLPLYIQDFLTDEKLNECSPATVGVYIKIMCIMHKSLKYGTILLRQKDKQSERQTLNFATKIAKQLPFEVPAILSAIEELLEEEVLYIEGNYLIQKRMLKDGELSLIRSKSGKMGAEKTWEHKHAVAN